MKALLNPFEEAERLAAENGKWVVAVIETTVFWPDKKQLITFDGKDFLLLPSERQKDNQTTTLPAIAIRSDTYGLSSADSRKEVFRLASALSWSEGGKIEIVSWSGGNLPRSMGIMRNIGITRFLDTEYLAAPTSEIARTAMAFYREGVSLSNPFYAFLSLYKAFSVAVANKSQRGPWINRHYTQLRDDRAKARVAELLSEGKDISAYLYDGNRHSIAHADQEPFVNPDSTDDHIRLTKDVPLMRGLVELAIEHELGVKSQSTIYAEHEYELAGWKKLLPASVVQGLSEGKAPSGTVSIDIPDGFLILAKRDHLTRPLPSVDLVEAGWTDTGLVLKFFTKAQMIRVVITLDFQQDRLIFDPLQDFGIAQGREALDCLQEEKAGLLFHRCILGNGHLEIWNLDTGERLGRSKEYIPLNMILNQDFFDSEYVRLDAAIEKLS